MENYQISILFLAKSGFSLYIPTLESPLSYTFTKETVQDMEVINLELLLAQLASFLKTYTVPPSTMTILLSQDLLFIQEIQTITPGNEENAQPVIMSAMEQQKKIQTFLDSVPFEIVESKTYPIDGGIRVVATNKTFYEAIITAFEAIGTTIKMVIPAFILGTETEGLTDEVITTVINNNEALKQESFVIHSQEIIALTPEEKKKEFLSLPQKQTKLYAYSSVFVVLIAIFGFMFKSMMDQNAADQATITARQATTQKPIAAVTPTNAIPVASFVASGSGALNRAGVSIQIQTNATTVTQGQLIKNKLQEKGYTNIILNSNAPTTTSKTLLIFSSTIDPSISQDITGVINNIFTTFSTQQAIQTSFSVTIIPSANL